MNIIVSQEELKQLTKDYMEKKGYAVNSIDISIKEKNSIPPGIQTHSNFMGRMGQPTNLDNLEVQMVCELNLN